MPTIKNETRSAKIANTDLRAEFYFNDNEPPELLFRLSVEHEDGSGASVTIKVDNAGLSGAERTGLNSVLTKLRDAAFLAGGYVTS